MLRTILLSVLVVVVAGAAFVLASSWRWSSEIDGDIAELIAATSRESVVVSADRLGGLPAAVQRYLAWSGVVGTTIPSVVRIRQTGRIRGAATSSWMALEADEVYSTRPPAFVWRAFFPKRSLPLVFGRDEYLDGKGSIVMKGLGVYPLAELSSDDLGPAGLMRYLNEMMWFPAAFLGDNVGWTAVDDNSAQVTLTDRGMSATATVVFDDDGRPVNFTALRFNTDTRRLERWETPMSAYGRFAGLNLPTKGAAVWKLADGDFTYVELDITDVSYDSAQ